MSSKFDLYDNLTEYNELVSTKYQDAPVLDAYQSAPSRQDDMMSISLEQYDAPEPAQTFAPKIIEDYVKPGVAHRNLIDVSTSGFLIDEIEAVDEPVTQSVREVEEETTTQFNTRFKLNNVGMVAVISFIAVTLLVLAFIIANSVSIGRADSRISALQAQNATDAAALAAKQAEIAQLYQQRGDIIKEMIEEGLQPDDWEFLGQPQDIVQNVPNGSWNNAPKSNGGGGFFDAIARFFNSLFR